MIFGPHFLILAAHFPILGPQILTHCRVLGCIDSHSHTLGYFLDQLKLFYIIDLLHLAFKSTLSF